MVSLLDLAERKETVELRGQQVEVNGITAEHLVTLFHSYPELRKLTTGHGDGDTIQSLINQAPMAMAQIIALGTAGLDAAEAEIKKLTAAARKLGAGEQYVILEKIASLTFPQGPKSFLERVGAAVGLQPDALLGKVQATKSQPSLSGASSQEETKEPAGAAPPEPSKAG